MFSFILIICLLTCSRFVFGISGGTPASIIGSWQGVGVVLIDNGPGLGNPSECQQMCTGVMVDYRLVLTNAACYCDQARRKWKTVVYMSMHWRVFQRAFVYYVIDYLEVNPKKNPVYELILLKLDREMKNLQDGMFLNLAGNRNPLNLTVQDFHVFGFGETTWIPRPGTKSGVPWEWAVTYDMQAISVKQSYHMQSVGECKANLKDTGQQGRDFLCFGRKNNPSKRLMYADNGAPLIGKEDRILYGLACARTDGMLKPGFNKSHSFPIFFNDIGAESNRIFRAIKILLNR